LALQPIVLSTAGPVLCTLSVCLFPDFSPNGLGLRLGETHYRSWLTFYRQERLQCPSGPARPSAESYRRRCGQRNGRRNGDWACCQGAGPRAGGRCTPHLWRSGPPLTAVPVRTYRGCMAGSTGTPQLHSRVRPSTMRCAANAANSLSSRTPAKLYSCETILKRLAQHFQDVVPALWEFFQAIPGGVRATPCLGSTPVRYSSRRPAHSRTARFPRDAERLDSIWRLSASLSGRTRVLAGPGHDHQHPRVRRLPACMLCP
jgi:hypothetical protein